MDQKSFDRPSFMQTLVYIKQLANTHQPRNEAARDFHNQVAQAGLTFIAQDIPDVAPVNDPLSVGRNIIALLQTIPGVATDADMSATVTRANSIAMSDRAISVWLRRQGKSEVGFSLTFAQPDWQKHKLEFERVDPQGQRVAISIELTPDGIPLGGEINIGSKEGQFVTPRQKIVLDAQGAVKTTNPIYGFQQGDRLNVPKLIGQITTAEGLGNPIDVTQILNLARIKMLPGV